ncbi:hypothetical protein [Actinosynnema sp. NPDC020468]|uniref:hypothetical protein n=1 Tax=Actinosynnema sp. NPDC020468 TaxID=3154488 RepID=UPI0033C9B6A8
MVVDVARALGLRDPGEWEWARVRLGVGAGPAPAALTTVSDRIASDVAHRTAEAQVAWLCGKGERHGFVIPTGLRLRPPRPRGTAPFLIAADRRVISGQ